MGVGRQGRLYLVATPIGNLADITVRALDVLRDADVVAAEDTRRTRRLFARYDIHTPLVSYREENRESAGRRLLARLQEGEKVALVSDAGTPGISDPGAHLVALCVENGIAVEALPGPNAALTALVVSGLPTRRFAFEGFLPRKQGARRRALEGLAGDPRTVIFYESPARVAATLEDMLEVLGDRRAAFGRELTKRFEQVERGKLSELLALVEEGEPRGEFVLVVDGASVGEGLSMEEALSRVDGLRAEGMSLKDAAAAVAAAGPGPSRSEIYNEALKRRG